MMKAPPAIVTVEVLLLESGSGSAAVTAAVLAIGPGATTRTVSRHSADPATASGPMFQVTTCPTAPAPQSLPTNASCGGSVSETCTPVAAAGPPLSTVKT